MGDQKLVSYQALLEKLPDMLYWGTYFQIVTVIPFIDDTYTHSTKQLAKTGPGCAKLACQPAPSSQTCHPARKGG